MSILLTSHTARANMTPVALLRVVVHTMGPATPTMSDNHWSIYLVAPNAAGSVRINMMAPEYGDPTGILVWSQHQYTVTTSAIKHWDYSVEPNVKVGHIADLIIRLRRDQYDMSGGGSGCRWWV